AGRGGPRRAPPSGRRRVSLETRALERRPAPLGEPLRKPSVGRGQVLANAALETCDLLPELEHQEIGAALPGADVVRVRALGEGRTAVGARHVARVGEG